MPFPAGTECPTIAEDELKIALSQCADVLLWLDADDADEALERIYINALPDPETAEVYEQTADEPPAPEEYSTLFPFALIYSDDDDGYSVRRVASMLSYLPSGRVSVRFERLLSETDLSDRAAAFRVMDNTIAAISRQLTERSPGKLLIERIDVGRVYSPRSNDEEYALPRACCTLRITWGVS